MVRPSGPRPAGFALEDPMQRHARMVPFAAAAALRAPAIAAGAVAAASPVVGHVYVNANTSGHNTIAGFDRHADGSLTPLAGSPFEAGGAGARMPFRSPRGPPEAARRPDLLPAHPRGHPIPGPRLPPSGGP